MRGTDRPGALLLIRRPFEEGDQIDGDGKNGTVELINLRETQLRTFDGQRYVIPNTDVYQSAVRVHTAFPTRRTSVLVGVDYDAAGIDIPFAIRTLDARFGFAQAVHGPDGDRASASRHA